MAAHSKEPPPRLGGSQTLELTCVDSGLGGIYHLFTNARSPFFVHRLSGIHKRLVLLIGQPVTVTPRFESRLNVVSATVMAISHAPASSAVSRSMACCSSLSDCHTR